MKTVINQKIKSIPSLAIQGKTLEQKTTIALLEVKEELVTKTSRPSDRLTCIKDDALPTATPSAAQKKSAIQVTDTADTKKQYVKKLAINLALALGTGGLILSPFVISAAVNLRTKAPTQVDSGSSPLSSLANISNDFGQSAQADTDFIYPLVTPAPLTSPFGWRRHPLSGQQRLHGGVDFEAPYGAPIVAAISGQVVVADWHGGHGKTVVIERQGKFQTLYAHMSKILVQKGQTVKQGEVIGYVGSTGRSTGAHLHFETLLPGKEKDNWVAVDPAPGIRYALDNRQQVTQVSSISRTNSFN